VAAHGEAGEAVPPAVGALLAGVVALPAGVDAEGSARGDVAAAAASVVPAQVEGEEGSVGVVVAGAPKMVLAAERHLYVCRSSMYVRVFIAAEVFLGICVIDRHIYT